MKKLFIVESPSKAKTISKYLGKDYKVIASFGHLVDLPSSHLGVDIQNNFTPEWEFLKGKKKIVQDILKELKYCDTVYLATDPDREGEAISFHIHNLIHQENKTFHRIRLKEITSDAVLKSIKEGGSIDLQLVDSQTTRRILDRITGYSFSPILWKFGKNLSAGRVQSPVLRWICEREKEILHFKKENIYSIEGTFFDKHTSFSVIAKYKNNDNKKEFKSNELKNILKLLNVQTKEEYINLIPGESIGFKIPNPKFTVLELKEFSKKDYPPPPFITSSLQKTAYQALKFSPTKTMKLAQSLFEGTNSSKGLITYLRTDSTRVSPGAINLALEYIPKNIPIPINPLFRSKLKSGKQDAHEAIRPTELHDKALVTNLTNDEKKLYDLIKNRYLTSFLAPHERKILQGILFDGKNYFEFRLENSIHNGYKDFAKISVQNDKFPNWKIGTEVLCKEGILHCRESSPPSRYKESGIIDKMEKTGIGRPSTFASTLETLYKRNYINQKKGELFPTPLGETINQEINSRFSELITDGFSSAMEGELDQISVGKKDGVVFLREIYSKIQSSLKAKIVIKTEEKQCPLCKVGHLKQKISREKKVYWLCSTFPYCEYAEYANQS
jgi:DNA topoisomerase-1